jgi:4-amino-4-deoxy-L-arabinose transferase-like glycosyltransferase
VVAVALAQNRERTRLLFVAAVFGVLGCYLTLQLWDVTHYDWLRGYDAWSSWEYTSTILTQHVLPTSNVSDVWHNPPLFYAVAALLQSHRARSLFGWSQPGSFEVVQLLSVVSGFAVVVLTFCTARELFPRSRWIQLGALGFVATVPILLRGSLMYHPDPLGAALAAGGVYAVVRATTRGYGLRRGAVAGLLLGLANLTRTWALAEAAAIVAILAVVWVASRRPEVLRFAAALTAVFAVLVAPWYVHQQLSYGSPLAFSKPDASQWLPPGRPLAFYTDLELRDVFANPYFPTYRNRLVPVLYADWWGDYARYFHVPSTETSDPAQLPAVYRRPLVLQSVVGVVPTLLALVGAVGLALVAVRRRRAGPAVVLAAAAAAAAAFVYFLVEYPKYDGDNIKAMYVLGLAPAFALCAAWGLDRVRQGGPLVLAGLGLWLAAVAYLDVTFLVL